MKTFPELLKEATPAPWVAQTAERGGQPRPERMTEMSDTTQPPAQHFAHPGEYDNLRPEAASEHAMSIAAGPAKVVDAVPTGSHARTFAEMFERARRSPHYWCEAIELCTTKKQRMSLAREIAEIVKAAQENA